MIVLGETRYLDGRFSLAARLSSLSQFRIAVRLLTLPLHLPLCLEYGLHSLTTTPSAFTVSRCSETVWHDPQDVALSRGFPDEVKCSDYEVSGVGVAGFGWKIKAAASSPPSPSS